MVDFVKNAQASGTLSATGTSRLVVSPEIGPTYLGIAAKMTGTSFDASCIDNIKASLNGKVGIEVTGAHLDTINDYRATAADADYLYLNLCESQAKDITSDLAGRWPTAEGVSSFNIEYTITDPGSGASLDTYSVITGPDTMVGAEISTLQKGTLAATAAGEWTLQLPTRTPGKLKRVYLFSTHITKVEAKKNGVVRHSAEVGPLGYIQKVFEGVPQSGLTVVDYVMLNHTYVEAIPTEDANSNTIKLTTDAADTIVYYIEMLQPLGNLSI